MKIFGFVVCKAGTYRNLFQSKYEEIPYLRAKIENLESILKAEIKKNSTLEHDLINVKLKNINDFEANLKDSKKKIMRMDERLANNHAHLMERLSGLEKKIKKMVELETQPEKWSGR